MKSLYKVDSRDYDLAAVVVNLTDNTLQSK